MADPSVHLVVLNWNGWRDTSACLDSLALSDYGPLHVSVVDNASTDGSREALIAWLAGRGARRGGDAAGAVDGGTWSPTGPWVVPRASGAPLRMDLVANEENLGFAEGNNRGIAHALPFAPAYLFVLNNDTVLAPDAVREMVREAERTGAAMVAPAVYDHAHRDLVDRFGIVITRSGSAYDRISELDGPLLCPSGCAALYRRDLVEALVRDEGGFYDRSFFAYNEDVDTGLRAVARGYRTAFAPRAIVYHKGSSVWGLGSPRSYYLRHRNAIWTVLKNYSAALLLREAPYLIAGQILGLVNALRRRRFRAVLKGKWEGLLGAREARRRGPAVRLRTAELIDRRFSLRNRARIAAPGAERPGGSVLHAPGG